MNEFAFFALSIMILALVCFAIALDQILLRHRTLTAMLANQAAAIQNQQRTLAVLADLAGRGGQFGFDLWRLVKVPPNLESVTIRRASRAGYKLLHRIEDGGVVYSVFQLCQDVRGSQ